MFNIFEAKNKMLDEEEFPSADQSVLVLLRFGYVSLAAIERHVVYLVKSERRLAN